MNPSDRYLDPAELGIPEGDYHFRVGLSHDNHFNMEIYGRFMSRTPPFGLLPFVDVCSGRLLGRRQSCSYKVPKAVVDQLQQEREARGAGEQYIFDQLESPQRLAEIMPEAVLLWDPESRKFYRDNGRWAATAEEIDGEFVVRSWGYEVLAGPDEMRTEYSNHGDMRFFQFRAGFPLPYTGINNPLPPRSEGDAVSKLVAMWHEVAAIDAGVKHWWKIDITMREGDASPGALSEHLRILGSLITMPVWEDDIQEAIKGAAHRLYEGWRQFNKEGE